MSLFRIAAIDFLNPAPLMWNFEHPPEAERLGATYSIQKMTPAACAEQLRSGEAELGLIPIAEYASIPDLAIVPGCAVASLGAIRSILLVLRATPRTPTGRTGPLARPALPVSSLFAQPSLAQQSRTEPDALTPAILRALRQVRTVALDTASRTSTMYTRILFAKYWRTEPRFLPHPAALDAMLSAADAALLIGDPALYALEERDAREIRTGEPLYYLDLGSAWRELTGLPWVSAFWAARLAGIDSAPGQTGREQIAHDLQASRDAGLQHLPALTVEWSARLGLPLSTVQAYLAHNIHYRLDDACVRGIDGFYANAEACGLIPRRPALVFL